MSDATFRRWKRELDAAGKREEKWRTNGEKIYNRYRARDVKKATFNILYANTEVLRPALYNSVPKPDVRRRFRDADPLGKTASEVMERSLFYAIDAYSFDSNIKNDVLDALLPGRGVSRIRYIPTLRESAPATPVEGKDGKEPPTATVQELEYEQVICEHVDWQDFRHGYGRTWDEVQWDGFRHKLNKADVKAKFGEDVAKIIKFDLPKDDEKKDKAEYGDEEQWAEFWEIWDKAGRKVFFINTGYTKGLLYPLDNPSGDPPQEYKDFFPNPEPLRMIEDASSLQPNPLWDQYCQQAEELNRVSIRINNLIDKIKARGLYDSTLAEVAQLVSAGEADMIPLSQAAKWMNNGGIEKAIWWMPVKELAEVLIGLYDARDRCKQVIYELTGISDIIRGATDPNETLGAQKIKANYGSLRLQRMQREVQRYIRDLLRLMSEVIGDKFQPETLAKMTGLKLPTPEEKAQMAAQMQQLQQPPAMPGQPQPDPQKIADLQAALQVPTWDDVMGILRDDMDREYRIDVETDSTIQESVDGDMQGLQEVLAAIGTFWKEATPLVQAGALSMEAAKAITMTIVRRARMGLEVEDAIEKGMKQPPPPPPNPELGVAQAKAQATVQATQIKTEADAQAKAQELAMEERARAAELKAEQQMAVFQEQLIAEREARQADREAAQAHMQAMIEAALEHFKANLQAETTLEVAEMNNQTTLDAAKIGAADQAVNDDA